LSEKEIEREEEKERRREEEKERDQETVARDGSGGVDLRS